MDNKLIISYVVFAIILVLGYFYIADLKNDLQLKDDRILIERQNVQALKDQLVMKSDSVQLFSNMVENLQTDISKKEQLYNVLNIKYNAALDTIKILKKQTLQPVETDSTIIIRFDGKDRFVTYDGNTVYYKKTKIGEYSLILAFDPILLKTEVYYDNKDSLLKTKIYSLTNGVNIDSAISVIDPQIYTMIHKASAECPELPPIYKPNFLDNFGIIVSGNQKLTYIDSKYSFEDFDIKFGLFYKADNFTTYVNKNILKNEFNIGISYGLSLRNMINFIF